MRDTDSDSDGAGVDDAALDAAARVVREGGAVVYPTETVYGLGADALDPAAVERVFGLKGRDPENPVSIAVPGVGGVLEYTRPTERERAFVERFLPGPVTVVLERRAVVPDAVTAGRDRVGIRVPDHPVVLALLRRVAPLTATSANRSGRGSASRTSAIDADVRDACGAVLDAGETPGTESTVVDPSQGIDGIVRRGARASAVEAWLAQH